MSLRKLLFDSANRAIRRLGYELRDARAPRHVFTMNDALRRTRARGCEVRTVIDVGASNGAWSNVAMRHFPDAHYLLFEPLRERAAELETFREIHPRVALVHAAAGEKPGETSFNVSSDLDGSSISDIATAATRRVPVSTIDLETKKRQLHGPFLIKLDTHGYEVPILAGAAECLQTAQLLVVEAYNFKLAGPTLRFHELCAHLEDLGFRCCDLADPLLRASEVLWQLDLFFIRKDAPCFASSTYT